MENAYERGFSDAEAGCTDENPYHQESQPDEFDDWDQGYNDYLESQFIEEDDEIY